MARSFLIKFHEDIALLSILYDVEEHVHGVAVTDFVCWCDKYLFPKLAYLTDKGNDL